jgi:hypothetical protein
MYHDYEASLSDWVAVLSIATRFGFQRVRERAIIEIDSTRFCHELGPVQKIVYAKDCDVQEWLPGCYEALCQRTTGLEDSEAEQLGAATANRIWKAREAVRACCEVKERLSFKTNLSEWQHRRYDASTVARIVREIFDLQPLPSNSGMGNEGVVFEENKVEKKEEEGSESEEAEEEIFEKETSIYGGVDEIFPTSQKYGMGDIWSTTGLAKYRNY